MSSYDRHYYDGAWQASSGTETIAVVSSATEQEVARVPRGTAADVDRAVQAARRGFEAWSRVPLEERAQWLEKLSAAMKTRVPQIAEAIAHEVGTALGYATKVQAEFPISMIGMNARFLREAKLEEELGNSLVVKEPIGVVGCVTPWNYPLHQVVCKIAPAFAAGCTIVLKPAEMAPLSAFMLADAAHEIGLPAGVLNIVSGSGRVVGEAIVAHPGIDMVSFTGSLQAGRRIASVAGDGIKKVCLELGGKSAFVVLDDAPFDKAIPAGVNNCMQNSGQTCSAWTRMIVPRARHDEAVELAKAQLAKLTVGDPFDKNTRLGPLASAGQRDTVLGYIEQGKKEGATLVAGGGRPANLPKGYYVEPTIFANVENRMTIAQEEIFGPVLAIIPCASEAEAISIANDSPYGLAGGVWAGTPDQALAVARQLRTGQVDINGGRFNVLAPFGGYKKSGIGREIGPLALEEFFQLKSNPAMTFAFFAGLAAGLLHVFSGPDHLAAVAPLAADGDRRQWRTGLQWGIGHTTGVLLIASLLLLLREQLPLEAISAYSERIVGAALILVGSWGIWKASRSGLRPHGHSHAGASFAMGTIHGLAGSSHLFGVLPALAFGTRVESMLYFAGFGAGAVAGMSAFAAAMGLLSTTLGQRHSRSYSGLLYASSAAALVIGGVWLVGR